MNEAQIQDDRHVFVRPDLDRKRLIDNRHFDQIVVGKEPIAWVLLDAEAFRNKESQEAWIDLQIRTKTYGKWSVDIPARLDFGTQAEVLFPFALPKPLSITCKDDTGAFYKIPISSSTYDRLTAIYDWDVTKTAAAQRKADA